MHEKHWAVGSKREAWHEYDKVAPPKMIEGGLS